MSNLYRWEAVSQTWRLLWCAGRRWPEGVVLAPALWPPGWSGCGRGVAVELEEVVRGRDQVDFGLHGDVAASEHAGDPA